MLHILIEFVLTATLVPTLYFQDIVCCWVFTSVPINISPCAANYIFSIMLEKGKDSKRLIEKNTELSVLCCVVGPSQQPVIPGWSQPIVVISPELSEVTACAAREKQSEVGITQRHD